MSGEDRCDEIFEAIVQSTGIKAFAAKMGLSTRQVHRMLGGAQPNPLRRLADVLKACSQADADSVLSYLCRQQGVYWVRVPRNIKAAHMNAVKESAEAIVAITDGQSAGMEIKEIREAIAALSALERLLDKPEPANGEVALDKVRAV